MYYYITITKACRKFLQDCREVGPPPNPLKILNLDFFMGLDRVRRSNYRPLKLITLLVQKWIGNYSAKLFVKTVTQIGVGGVDGVDATPHNRRTSQI